MEHRFLLKAFSISIVVIGVLLASNIYLFTNPIKEVQTITKEIATTTPRVKIETPLSHKITRTNRYSLDCSSIKYTDMSVGGSIIPQSSVSIYDGHERQVLYVNGDKAQYFGADYDVIGDNEDHLIIVRFYELSGLVELISIDKSTGVGFDTNTKMMSITGAPSSQTYLISCSQV